MAEAGAEEVVTSDALVRLNDLWGYLSGNASIVAVWVVPVVHQRRGTPATDTEVSRMPSYHMDTEHDHQLSMNLLIYYFLGKGDEERTSFPGSGGTPGHHLDLPWAQMETRCVSPLGCLQAR